MTLVALFAMTTGAWAADYYVVGSFTDWNPKEAYKLTLNTACTTAKEYMLTVELPADAQFKVVQAEGISIQAWFPEGLGNNYGENGELPGAGWYTIYFRPDYNGNEDWFYNTIYVAASEAPEPAPEGPKVTINEAKTEAWFNMPTYDMTVDYELVRDMASNMPVTVGDGTDGYRIRLKKEGTSFVPAEMTPQQMAGLIAVTDGIESKTLTNMTDYTISIYAVNDEDEPTGEAITFQSLTPGRYVAIASAVDGTIYDGETEPSNIFVLFQGYEVKVDGGEYATYYKDEKLKLDESVDGGVLYTISSVSATEAMLSDQINVAPALTPLIVHNSSAEAKTFILLPTEDQADEVQYAPEFKGTLTGTTLAASTNDQTNYALNGKQFVWVKSALSVPANKCWLEVVNSNARAISILFTGETTGINAIDNEKLTIDNDSWYDLNGRKVLNPTRKGIYIQNGKKVVIK